MFLLISLCISKVYVSAHEEKSFLGWMRTNGQFYTGDEYHFRLGIYLANVRFINEFNKAKHTFHLCANKFSAMTKSEYQVRLGLIMSKEEAAPHSPVIARPNDDIPDSYDLRDKGVIQKVKDQGNCGSCWAFGAVASQEANWALATGKLYSLSESNLVDCVWDCLGCNGGNPGFAMTYLKLFQSGKFALDSDYPYTPFVQSCYFDKTKGVTKLSTHYSTWWGNEEDLKQSIYHNGAHAIGMDAMSSLFSQYAGGIFEDPTCLTVWQNHCMCAFGFGVEDGTPYWLVKNSWGKDWGEEGIIRVIRGKNMCGIASQPVYPVEQVD